MCRRNGEEYVHAEEMAKKRTKKNMRTDEMAKKRIVHAEEMAKKCTVRAEEMAKKRTLTPLGFEPSPRAEARVLPYTTEPQQSVICI